MKAALLILLCVAASATQSFPLGVASSAKQSLPLGEATATLHGDDSRSLPMRQRTSRFFQEKENLTEKEDRRVLWFFDSFFARFSSSSSFFARFSSSTVSFFARDFVATSAPTAFPTPLPADLACKDSILRPITTTAECPADPGSLQNCESANDGELCEADGECATSTILDNCNSWDVYRKYAPTAFSVVYAGYEYATMDKCTPTATHDQCASSCQSEFLRMPEGWGLVPYSSSIATNVVANYGFGTHTVLFSDGSEYRTNNLPDAGTRFGCCYLQTDGTNHKVSSGCSHKVLMRREATETAGNATAYPTPKPSTNTPTPIPTPEPAPCTLRVMQSANSVDGMYEYDGLWNGKPRYKHESLAMYIYWIRSQEIWNSWTFAAWVIGPKAPWVNGEYSIRQRTKDAATEHPELSESPGVWEYYSGSYKLDGTIIVQCSDAPQTPSPASSQTLLPSPFPTQPPTPSPRRRRSSPTPRASAPTEQPTPSPMPPLSDILGALDMAVLYALNGDTANAVQLLSGACNDGTSAGNTTEMYIVGQISCQLENNLNNRLDVTGLQQRTIGDVPWDETLRIVNANIDLIDKYQDALKHGQLQAQIQDGIAAVTTAIETVVDQSQAEIFEFVSESFEKASSAMQKGFKEVNALVESNIAATRQNFNLLNKVQSSVIRNSEMLSAVSAQVKETDGKLDILQRQGQQLLQQQNMNLNELKKTLKSISSEMSTMNGALTAKIAAVQIAAPRASSSGGGSSSSSSRRRRSWLSQGAKFGIKKGVKKGIKWAATAAFGPIGGFLAGVANKFWRRRLTADASGSSEDLDGVEEAYTEAQQAYTDWQLLAEKENVTRAVREYGAESGEVPNMIPDVSLHANTKYLSSLTSALKSKQAMPSIGVDTFADAVRSTAQSQTSWFQTTMQVQTATSIRALQVLQTMKVACVRQTVASTWCAHAASINATEAEVIESKIHMLVYSTLQHLSQAVRTFQYLTQKTSKFESGFGLKLFGAETSASVVPLASDIGIQLTTLANDMTTEYNSEVNLRSTQGGQKSWSYFVFDRTRHLAQFDAMVASTKGSGIPTFDFAMVAPNESQFRGVQVSQVRAYLLPAPSAVNAVPLSLSKYGSEAMFDHDGKLLTFIRNTCRQHAQSGMCTPEPSKIYSTVYHVNGEHCNPTSTAGFITTATSTSLSASQIPTTPYGSWQLQIPQSQFYDREESLRNVHAVRIEFELEYFENNALRFKPMFANDNSCPKLTPNGLTRYCPVTCSETCSGSPAATGNTGGMCTSLGEYPTLPPTLEPTPHPTLQPTSNWTAQPQQVANRDSTTDEEANRATRSFVTFTTVLCAVTISALGRSL